MNCGSLPSYLAGLARNFLRQVSQQNATVFPRCIVVIAGSAFSSVITGHCSFKGVAGGAAKTAGPIAANIAAVQVNRRTPAAMLGMKRFRAMLLEALQMLTV